MVTSTNQAARTRGSLMAELMVAIAMLMAVMLPIAYSFNAESRLARSYYTHAVAMEIVDGEMEVLQAGEWRAFTPGTHPYQVRAEALTNLPPGEFTLTLQTNKIRLEWQPALKQYGGPVSREAMLK